MKSEVARRYYHFMSPQVTYSYHRKEHTEILYSVLLLSSMYNSMRYSPSSSGKTEFSHLTLDPCVRFLALCSNCIKLSQGQNTLLLMRREARWTFPSFTGVMRMHLKRLEMSPKLISAKVHVVKLKNGVKAKIDIGRFELLDSSCIRTCWCFSGPKPSERFPLSWQNLSATLSLPSSSSNITAELPTSKKNQLFFS